MVLNKCDFHRMSMKWQRNHCEGNAMVEITDQFFFNKRFVKLYGEIIEKKAPSETI